MNNWKFFSIAITGLLLSMGFMFISPHVEGANGSSSAGDGETLWDVEIPFKGTEPIDGVALGDVDSTHTGSELVWVARDMKVYTGYYDDDGSFHYDDIWTSGGQQLTPAIGDIRPDIPGNEILVAGLSSGMEDDNAGTGTAEVLFNPGTGWQNQRAFSEEQLIHGAAIGDLDPTIPGEEGLLASFGWNLTMIWWDTETNTWNDTLIFTDIGNIRKVVIADILPDDIHPGNEMVSISKGGRVTLAYGDKDNGWTVDVVYENPEIGFARVAVGDVDPNVPGLEIYTGTDTFEVIGFKRDGTSWDMQKIYKDANKNRGVWVGDVDPQIPGNELYAFGYTAKLFQITGSFGSGWNVKTLWTDVARGHEIRIGDIHPDEGNEIAVVGYSANVTIVKTSGWQVRVPFKGSEPIDGIAVGDIDSAHAGSELVWVARDMKVYTGYYDNSGSFHYDDIWTSGGQQLTPAIGDLRPDIPGNEILVVGLSSGMEDDNAGRGTAEVLFNPGTGWQNQRAFSEEQLIHGAAIGDIDPTIPGEEGLLASFGWNVTMIWWDTETNTWNNTHIFTDIGNVRKIVIADILPDSIHPGNEMVSISKGGRVTVAYGNKDDGWTVDVVYENTDIGFARIAVGDVDPNAPGLEIYTGTDTFEIIGFKRDGTSWDMQKIYKDANKNRGVWVGDVDPNIPGNELYAFGYTAKLFQITGDFTSGWDVKALWTDVARGHEIRIADIHPDEGIEIAVVGYSANVSVISRMDVENVPGPTIIGGSTQTFSSGSENTIKLEVKSDSKMYFSVNAIDGMEVELLPETMYASGSLNIKVVAPYVAEDTIETLVLTVKHGSGTMTFPIDITTAEDVTAPTIVDITTLTGKTLTDGDEVLWNDTIIIMFSEPVSANSFLASQVDEGLKVEWGGEIMDVELELSEDGRWMNLNLVPYNFLGNIMISFEGLEDQAGLEMVESPIELRVQGNSSDDENCPECWVIGIILIGVVLIGTGIFFFTYTKKKEEDEEQPDKIELPKEPKQI